MRLSVAKTLKLYINGKFPRSESGRTMPVEQRGGEVVNVARASRKDLRDSIGVARSAQSKWAGRTAYNRGQILYRLAEMLEGRSTGFPATAEQVAAAADRAVHHAGWADKITAVLSTLNPVSGTFVNYSKVRPLGVVVAAPDPEDGLLGMVEALCTSALMGNGTVLLVEAEQADAAIALAECLHTSDWPAGAINVLTGDVAELVGVACKHDDVDGLLLFGARGELDRAMVDTEAARVLRRIVRVGRATQPMTPIDLQRLAEVQTVWMSAYEPKGGAAAY